MGIGCGESNTVNYLAEDDGFTLIETLVAFTIFLMAFGVLYPIFSSSHARIDVANQRGMGLVIATALMEEEVLIENWADLPKEGIQDGWNWRVSSAAFAHVSDSETAPGDLFELKVVLTPIDARIGSAIELNRVVWQADG